jgi:hypothetical protein
MEMPAPVPAYHAPDNSAGIILASNIGLILGGASDNAHRIELNSAESLRDDHSTNRPWRKAFDTTTEATGSRLCGAVGLCASSYCASSGRLRQWIGMNHISRRSVLAPNSSVGAIDIV